MCVHSTYVTAAGRAHSRSSRDLGESPGRAGKSQELSWIRPPPSAPSGTGLSTHAQAHTHPRQQSTPLLPLLRLQPGAGCPARTHGHADTRTHSPTSRPPPPPPALLAVTPARPGPAGHAGSCSPRAALRCCGSARAAPAPPRRARPAGPGQPLRTAASLQP